MISLENFGSKILLVNDLSDSYFKKKIFGNEVVWTYAIGRYAQNNMSIYNLISGFSQKDQHVIILEGQPLTPYRKMEGNSYIDMALGAINFRNNTESGIQYADITGTEVCFVEAKYLSDLSVKTEYSPIRNQMDRVIENLLCLEDEGKYPEKLVFTMMTPRLFKENYGSRLYSYKFNEYNVLMQRDKSKLIDRIELISESTKKRFEYTKEIDFIKNRLESLSLRWVTFEEIFEMIFPDLQKLDITKVEDARLVWNRINQV